MNMKVIGKIIGKIMILEGILMCFPLIVSFIYLESYIYKLAFIIPIAILLIGGYLLQLLKPKRNGLYQKEGFAVCALVWIVMTIFGALPFMISGEIKNFINAIFETMSGLTTTGASILDGVEELNVTDLSHSILFWRSFTHWIGGMGILVFILIFIPESDDGSALHLLKAESPGPQVGKMTSKLKITTRILYLIYLGMTIIEVAILLFDRGNVVDGVTYKMDLFNALLTTFGSAGTGGFGFVANSMEFFSPYAQYVTATFLILFGINFTLYYLILIGKFKEVIKSEELKTYFGLIFSAIVIIMISVLRTRVSTIKELTPTLFEGTFRATYFQVTSIITSTGYTTANFDTWPVVARTMLIVLMFCGAMAGSTGGGMKISRIVIVFKGMGTKIRKLINPRYVGKTKFDGKTLDDETINDVFGFVAMYFIIVIIVTLILGLDPSNGLITIIDGHEVKHDFLTNFSATLSCLSNIGPGLEAVGPYASFACYNNFSTLLLTLTMLVGRLEILPVLILFNPKTWRK